VAWYFKRNLQSLRNLRMSENKQQEATTGITPEQEVSDMTASTDAPAVPQSEEVADAVDAPRGRGQKGQGGNDRRNQRRPRRGSRPERVRPEFDQKIISIRRVTRVMAGGRRFSFSVAMVIGDKHGKVGVGIGKAGDTQLAIEKAVRDAKKHMITVPMNKEGHLPHDVHTKYASSEVMIMPAPGRGLVAGSSVRTVLEHAGVKDVTAKIFSRSKNKLNNARAAVEALKLLKKN
jgi:small subunit ribosomal protein S5